MVRLPVVAVYLEGQPKALRGQTRILVRQTNNREPVHLVARPPAVISALNKEVTRLTGQKPVEAIKEKTVPSKPSIPYLRPVGVNEKKLPSGLSVRYLYQLGELEGGRRRATDPIWSLKVYEIRKIMIKLAFSWTVEPLHSITTIGYSLLCKTERETERTRTWKCGGACNHDPYEFEEDESSYREQLEVGLCRQISLISLIFVQYIILTTKILMGGC